MKTKNERFSLSRKVIKELPRDILEDCCFFLLEYIYSICESLADEDEWSEEKVLELLERARANYKGVKA